MKLGPRMKTMLKLMLSQAPCPKCGEQLSTVETAEKSLTMICSRCKMHILLGIIVINEGGEGL